MFGWLVTLFNLFLYQPLFNFLIIIYNWIPGHDFGIAIIILTAAIRLILYPTSVKALNSQRALQKLQPKIQAIQEQYKNDKEKQAKETLELYKKEKINPFSSLLLALIQLPILIALYRVFWSGLNIEELKHLYSFVQNPGQINAISFALVDLSKPNLYLAVIAGILQFWQTKMLLPQPQKNTQKKEGDFSSIMQKQMTYLFPFLTVFILFRLPSALGLYWAASSLFSIVQQYYIIKKFPDTND